MYIVLPNERDGLNELEKSLASQNFDTLTSNVVLEEEINVVIPKFKLEETLELVPILKSVSCIK